uniref:Putative group i salivary lipocalin n=1 Tax=Rhipicephalus pulchellus TaxID=72859 RepID=L7LQB4_RHIPC
MRFVIVICSFGLAAASFDYTGRPTLEDVKNFYDSGEPIYILKRSFELLHEKYNVICIYNEKQELQNTKLTIKEAYALGTSIYYYMVTINLTPGKGMDDAPVMEATPGRYKWRDSSTKWFWDGGRYEQGRNTRKYRFQYYDKSQHCAVLTFDDGIKRCELHFWAREEIFVAAPKHIRGQPPPSPSGFENCEREYKNLCPDAKSYDVYSSQCKNWFLPKLRDISWQPVLIAEKSASTL